MIKSGLTVQKLRPQSDSVETPCPQSQWPRFVPVQPHVFFFAFCDPISPPKKKSPKSTVSIQMGFLDPFGPFLAHFDPPWGPLEPPMQPFGGSERLAGAAMTGRGAEAPRGGEGEGRARVCGKTQLITRFCTFSK